MAIIYKATNIINHKCYIGYTDSTLQRRKDQHNNVAKWRKGKSKRLSHFHNALLAYGQDAFSWEIIYESKDSTHCLEVMENYFINQYDSLNNGYNGMEGGFKGPRLFGSANGMYGKTHTAEVKAKLSECAKRSKNKSYQERYGLERAEELRRQRSVVFKAYRLSNNYIGSTNPNFNTNTYTLKHIDGNIIETTIYNFSQLNPTFTKSCISRLVNGHLKSYKGWSLQFPC